MRLVDFLILLLEAHAQTLQRLAALFGEEVLLEMLEQAGDAPGAQDDGVVNLDPSWLTRDASGSQSNAYAELEGAVRELNLPAILEFHLWAYPHYRAFIESPLDLHSRISGAGNDAGLALVEEAVSQARGWIRKLPMSPAIAIQAERAAQVPWLRFRTMALTRMGQKPLGVAR